MRRVTWRARHAPPQIPIRPSTSGLRNRLWVPSGAFFFPSRLSSTFIPYLRHQCKYTSTW